MNDDEVGGDPGLPARADPARFAEETELAVRVDSARRGFAAMLEGRELAVFLGRWRADPPRSLEEVGEELGISRERAHQFEKRVLDRARKYVRAELGNEVDVMQFLTGRRP